MSEKVQWGTMPQTLRSTTLVHRSHWVRDANGFPSQLPTIDVERLGDQGRPPHEGDRAFTQHVRSGLQPPHSNPVPDTPPAVFEALNRFGVSPSSDPDRYRPFPEFPAHRAGNGGHREETRESVAYCRPTIEPSDRNGLTARCGDVQHHAVNRNTNYLTRFQIAFGSSAGREWKPLVAAIGSPMDHVLPANLLIRRSHDRSTRAASLRDSKHHVI